MPPRMSPPGEAQVAGGGVAIAARPRGHRSSSEAMRLGADGGRVVDLLLQGSTRRPRRRHADATASAPPPTSAGSMGRRRLRGRSSRTGLGSLERAGIGVESGAIIDGGPPWRRADLGRGGRRRRRRDRGRRGLDGAGRGPIMGPMGGVAVVVAQGVRADGGPVGAGAGGRRGRWARGRFTGSMGGARGTGRGRGDGRGEGRGAGRGAAASRTAGADRGSSC